MELQIVEYDNAQAKSFKGHYGEGENPDTMCYQCTHTFWPEWGTQGDLATAVIDGERVKCYLCEQCAAELEHVTWLPEVKQ